MTIRSHAHTSWWTIAKLAGVGAMAAISAAVALRHERKGDVPQVPAAAAPVPVAPADMKLPPSTESDATLRKLLGSLSTRPLFQRWLTNDHLLERLAAVIDNLGEGRSPAHELPFLAPKRHFSADRQGSRLVIAERSYRRYDAFVNVVYSLDARRIGDAYRSLHPLLEAAYHALGYPDRPLDGAVKDALQRIADAPVRRDVRVRPAGALFVFDDPQLEALSPLDKQLVRMGPQNTTRLQEQARDLALALGMTLAPRPVAAAQ